VRLKYLLLAVPLLLAPAACTPRRPVVVVPPPPPPPPPEPEITPEEEAAAKVASARRAWEQGTEAGRQGRLSDAERLYRQATVLQPDTPVYHMALASVLLQQERWSEGADEMLAGIRAEEALPNPNHRVLAVDYERLIQLLDRLGRLDEARTARERQRFHRTMRDAAPPR
jgi:thioredoxin-like negative regulator of GroEL